MTDKKTPIAAAALAAAICMAAAPTHADDAGGEGMWLPSQLPAIADQLRAAGYKGDPAALADLTKPPMNDVVSLGGCTASLVSPEGLRVTHHPCARGDSQVSYMHAGNPLEKGLVGQESVRERVY